MKVSFLPKERVFRTIQFPALYKTTSSDRVFIIYTYTSGGGELLYKSLDLTSGFITVGITELGLDKDFIPLNYGITLENVWI